MRTLRSNFRGIYTPTAHFEHKKTGHKITFYGAMHVASGRFYRNFLHEARKFDGEVHLEGVKIGKDVNTEIKLPLNELYILMAQALNAKSQKDYVSAELIKNEPERFLNHDLEMNPEVFKQMMELIEPDDVQKVLDQFNDKPESIKTKLMLSAFNFFATIVFMTGFVGKADKVTSAKIDAIKRDKFILEERNEYASMKAMESSKDVLMFWGAAHLKGMKKIFEDNGYVKVGKTEWRRTLPLYNRSRFN